MLLLGGGCSKADMVPVRGQVMYQGKPLEFGSVMFQPQGGLSAYGTIGSDGSFQLTTPTVGEGVKRGLNKVRVTCYEAQRRMHDGGESLSLGKLLIPKKYTDFATSGLEREITSADEECVIRLE